MSAVEIHHVSYEPGEFLLIRTADVVVLADDSASTSEAVNALIAAVTLGDQDALMALAIGAPQFMSLAVLLRADAGWRIYLYGHLACATESTSAMTVTNAKPDQLHFYDLFDSTSVLFHRIGADPIATTVGTALAAGAARAANAVVDFDEMARVVSLVAESPTKTAAVLAQEAVASSAVVQPEPTPTEDHVPKTTRMVLPTSEPPAALAPMAGPSPAAPPPQHVPAVTPSSSPIQPDPAVPPSYEPANVDIVDLGAVQVPSRPALAVPSPAAPSPDPAPGPVVVEVLGVRCPVDHHNHPNAVYCAQCGRRMGVNQTTVALPGPRPPLGLFLLNDGSSYPIASDMIVGRDPSGHDEVVGGVAGMLRLSDDRSEISRSHVGVYLDNWSVTVIDLGSANGTMVRKSDEAEWTSVSAESRVLLNAGDTLRVGGHELRLELHHVQA